MPPHEGEPSPKDLLSQLSNQATELIREEIQLAKRELIQKAREASFGAVLIGAGSLFALSALSAFVEAVIDLLDVVLPRWLAATVAGMLVAGLGGVLALKGVDALRQADLVPRQTIASVKEDAQWMKEQTQQPVGR